MILLSLSLAGASQGTERQRAAVQRCLANWDDHPFSDSPDFREAKINVRVLQRADVQSIDEPTDTPQLIYVEPNVNVLSRVTYRLSNPNGWYCLNNNVDVLSKIRFELECGAHLTASRNGATVLGADDADKGVTVLGSVRIERKCVEQRPEEPEPEPVADVPAPSPAPRETDRKSLAVQRCLKNWGTHPFDEEPRWTEASLEVRVLQRGDVEEVGRVTAEPALIYVEPNVNVLSRVTYELVNPNGWYCFNNNVDVGSQVRFELHCDAHLTGSRSGADVLARDDVDKGVTVLGSTTIERRCEPTDKPRYFQPSK